MVLAGLRVAATWPQAFDAALLQIGRWPCLDLALCSSISFRVGMRPGLGSPSDEP